MPRGGQNAKPTKLKVIQGTFRKDQASANEVKPKPALTLDVPKGLDQYAKRAWRQLAPILRKLGLLTEADLHSFVALCEAWSRFERARRRARTVFKKRMSYTVEHLDLIRKVEVSVERAEHSWRQLSAEFGLTDASRTQSAGCVGAAIGRGRVPGVPAWVGRMTPRRRMPVPWCGARSQRQSGPPGLRTAPA